MPEKRLQKVRDSYDEPPPQPRPYQEGDLREGDIITIGASPTRWRVHVIDGVITFRPVGQYNA